ncbi:MAG: DUF1598 domain-containing protein [Fuerstiella sp.]|nr:DUF1598 domain-containing protein [Fuerstiella sp.]
MLRKSVQLFTAVTCLCFATASASDKSAEPGVHQKAAQLKMEARIAAERGEFDVAVRNIMEASEMTGDRQTATRARKLTKSAAANAAGGSPFADFTQIMTLIQEQTTPPARWITVDGEGGAMTAETLGVFVGGPAFAAMNALMSSDSRLLQAAEFARNANQNKNIRKAAKLRMVSIPRLEQHVRKLEEQGLPVTDELRNMAGISRIDYLFVFPETGDVVIAGPAGDWTVDAEGRAISSTTHRPTLNLDDLVTLTRTFGQTGPGYFLCTIVPKKGQVGAVQDFVKNNQQKLNAQTAAEFTQEVEQTLGLQNVFVRGVPQNSRVASVIVEADYRMKEIGIGKRQGPKGMKSYFDLLTRSEQRGSSSMDALRWWMSVGYDAIRMSPDGKAFEFSGNSVECLSENQFVHDNGDRTGTGKASRANTKFAELFTKHLPDLAAQDPVFADLENILDLAMVSALIHERGLGLRAGWTPDVFAANGDYRTRSVEVPQELMTAAEFRVFDGRSVVVQVAGGVRVDVADLISDKDRLQSAGELASRSDAATPIGQQQNRWWWDAVEK